MLQEHHGIIIGGGYHVVVGVEEVGVIGKPAEPKHDQHNDEHLSQLKISNCEDY